MATIEIPDDIRAMSFEAAMAELETLVGKMENGGVPLAELVQGFERGRQLTEYCRGELNNLERKITVLAKDDGAAGEWQDFDPGSGRSAAPDDPPF